MITFIAFVLTILGCLNWLLIGLLQYDFIAGLFGFQASIFSRIFYIIFGVGAIYLVVRTIINKGTFKIYEKKKKKVKEAKLATANVEASKEQVNQNTNEKPEQQNQTYNNMEENSLFDEHLNMDIK